MLIHTQACARPAGHLAGPPHGVKEEAQVVVMKTLRCATAADQDFIGRCGGPDSDATRQASSLVIGLHLSWICAVFA